MIVENISTSNLHKSYLTAPSFAHLDKDYWVGEFSRLRPLYDSLTTMADAISPYNDEFAGARGVNRLESVVRGTCSRDRARMAVTAILADIAHNSRRRASYKLLTKQKLQLS